MRRGGRSARAWNIYLGMFLTIFGAAGVGLAGTDSLSLRIIGVIWLGIMLLGVVAIFVLVDFNAADFEPA